MDEPECLLLVEDEPDVRSSFRIWLERLNPRPRILEAESARNALELANQYSIDLVILDWNLGAGINGLELLTSLKEFHPDIVAILVTGYADLATPLHALRLGVRDYLDKHAGLDESAFLGSVQAQLEQLRPKKREKRVQRELQAFRESVSQALPWLRHVSDLKPRTEANAVSLTALLRLLSGAFSADLGALVICPEEKGTPWRALDSHTGIAVELNDSLLEGTIAQLCLASGEPVHLPDYGKAEQSGEIHPAPWEKPRKPTGALAIPVHFKSGGCSAFCFYSFGNPSSLPTFSGQADRLSALVEPALASHPVHPNGTASATQWMTALEEALSRAQQLGNSLENHSSEGQPQVLTGLVENVRADLEKCWQESLPPGAGEAASKLLGTAADLAREFGTPALDHARKLVIETARFLRGMESGR